MPMPPYPIRCHGPGCQELAAYKIAARWSDGSTEELKTYSLACPSCLAEQFRQSQHKQKACRKAAGEILEPPGIYRLRRGQRDPDLAREIELEQRVARGS